MSDPTPGDLATFRNFFRNYADYDIGLMRHARQQMQRRRITLPQIRRVLDTGTLTDVESDIRTVQDKYRVAGRDADGRDLEVVVTLGPRRRVKVVTAF